MNKLIDNYINGNLKEARHAAKRFTHANIRHGLIARYGYSLKKACLCADWLKDRDCWQATCDEK